VVKGDNAFLNVHRSLQIQQSKVNSFLPRLKQKFILLVANQVFYKNKKIISTLRSAMRRNVPAVPVLQE